MQTHERTAAELVHRLLFQALLEMRSQGHEHKNKVVFHLADLFHNIVLEMEGTAEGRRSYEDVFKSLQEKAKEKGLDRWLTANLEQLSQ
jgi:hypothetical protein